jgi:glycosyltransferase involved in cell wall biosynthesis
MTHPRVALVQDWLTGMRGGEKVLEALCEMFPDAVIFTLLHVPGSVSATIERHEIRTSFIQHLPASATKYRNYLPLFPLAISRFDLSGFDLIISSSHCAAKAIPTPKGVPHLCYCHTPMRYIWNLYNDYFGPGRAGLLTRAAMRSILGSLRRWDVQTASHPTLFIANSENIRQRIKDIYNRDAVVVYPPVDVTPGSGPSINKGFFLMVTAMVPYKRVDIAIEACNRTGDRLVIVGTGPDRQRLERIAGPSVEFRGWASDEEVRELYSSCAALLFPGEEDFGMVPVEAMAFGKPVIAFAKGGALETVRDTPSIRTGILFNEQTAESLQEAISTFKKTIFNAEIIRNFALQFDKSAFRRSFSKYLPPEFLQL